MATVNITEQYLSDIGDAIRAKRDVSTKYKPSQMASAIRGIRSASDVKLIPKVIRENGRYESLSEDNADGYNVISVDVVGRDAIVDDLTITENGTYNPADSGLDYFSQVTAEVEAEPNVDSKTITQNGTYSAADDELDGYDEVTVNVSPNVGSKSITSNGNYQAESDNLDGYSSVDVAVEPNVGTKTITENGTYNASTDELDGYSRVTVNVSGGGGNVEIIPQADWDEMTTEQKQAKGLVVIQYNTIGYERGIYVNGADYKETIALIDTYGRKVYGGSSYTVFTANNAGQYSIYVILLNSEASTYALNIVGSIDGVEQTKTSEYTNNYSSWGSNKRNSRIAKYDVEMDVNDDFVVSVSNANSYTTMMVYVTDKNDCNNLNIAMSNTDNTSTLSDTINGVLLYGYVGGSSGNTNLNYAYYSQDEAVSITTPDGDHSYGSSYIFNFVESE